MYEGPKGMINSERFEISILGYRLGFTDREEEVRILVELVENGSPVVEFVYGPEGCGKTTLLRYVSWFLSKRRDVIALYVDALEHDFSKVVLGVDIPRQELVELVKVFTGPLGALLATKLTELIEVIASKLKLSGKKLALFVDDPIKALGLEKSEVYVKWLYELIYKVSKEYNVEKILVLATSSEGLSRRRLQRHTYLHVSLLWNLSYDGLIGLIKQLPRLRLSYDEVWLYTGGNPRAVIDLALHYKWDINEWLEELKYRYVEVVKEVKYKGLDLMLRKVIEDPDILWEDPGAKELVEILERENLIIYKYNPMLVKKALKENMDLGIGKYYAWQIPAYREVLKRLLYAV